MKLTNGRLIDSYTPYDNELYEKVLKTSFVPEDRLIVDTIIRMTLGYKVFGGDGDTRMADRPMSYRYLEQLTGIPKSTVEIRVKKLSNRHILLKGWDSLWLKDKNGVQQKRRTVKLGINFDFWQWDRKGNFIEYSEYQKLCDRAKEFVRDYIEGRNPEFKLVKAKKRDKVHFRILRRDHHIHNAMVILLPSWDGVSKVKVKITDPQPNTYYFYVNKEVTSMFEITPSMVEQQTIKIARPVIDCKYVEIPKEGIKIFVGSSINHFEPIPAGVSPKRSEGDDYPTKQLIQNN